MSPVIEVLNVPTCQISLINIAKHGNTCELILIPNTHCVSAPITSATFLWKAGIWAAVTRRWTRALKTDVNKNERLIKRERFAGFKGTWLSPSKLGLNVFLFLQKWVGFWRPILQESQSNLVEECITNKSTHSSAVFQWSLGFRYFALVMHHISEEDICSFNIATLAGQSKGWQLVGRSTILVQREIVWSIPDGFRWYFVQIFIVSRGWIALILVTTWPFLSSSIVLTFLAFSLDNLEEILYRYLLQPATNI